MHGAINFYETGIYLPQISEFFHGSVLYKDIFVLRGPLEILMPAFLMKFFGLHIGVLNAYFYLGTVVTLIIYAFLAKGFFRTRGFLYLFTLVLIARTFPWSCFNVWGGIRFGLGVLPVLLAVDFLKNKKPSRLLFAGMFSSLAFWTSFELGAFSFISIMAAIILNWFLETKDKRAILRHILFYAAGNIIASFPFVFYLAAHGALNAYFNSVYVVLTKTSQVFNPALCFETPMNLKEFLMALSPLNHNFKYTLPFLFYIGVGIYLLVKALEKRIRSADIYIICLGIYGILLYKGSFRDVEGPQYRMALQPLLLIMFFYIEDFYMKLKGMRQGLIGFKKALVICLLFIVPFYALIFSFSKYNKRFFIFKEIKYLVANHKHIGLPNAQPDQTLIQTLRGKGITAPGPQAKEVDGVVSFIISNTKGREIVFTFPDLGTYNFLTDRPSAGRFYPAELSFIDPQWFNEVFAELQKTRPRFIICAKEYARLKPFIPTVGKYLDIVDMFLQENYKIRASFDTLNVLERKI